MGKKTSRRVERALNAQAAASANEALSHLERKVVGSKGGHAAAAAAAATAAAAAGSGVLSPELQAELGIADQAGDALGGAVVLSASNAEKKKVKRALQIKRRRDERASQALDRASKKKVKKLAKLTERKEKEARRGELFTALETHRLSDAHHALLTKGTSVGQRATRKQKAAAREKLRAAGLLAASDDDSGGGGGGNDDDDAEDEDEDDVGEHGEDGGGEDDDDHNDGGGGGGGSIAPASAASLDDMMGAIFSSKRQRASQVSTAVGSSSTERAGDAKRALNKLRNPSATPHHQFGTLLSVPGFLNRFDAATATDEYSQAQAPPQKQQQDPVAAAAAAAAAAVVEAAKQAALARHAAERAAKEAAKAALSARAVKPVITAARVLPAFNVPVAARQSRDSVQQARLELPVCAMEQEIMEAVNYHDIVVLCGPTGSGKTTQVPQFLYEAGYGTDPLRPGMIAVTQPRRVAAMSVARRVALELGQPSLAGESAAAAAAAAAAAGDWAGGGSGAGGAGGQHGKKRKADSAAGGSSSGGAGGGAGSSAKTATTDGLVAYQVRHDRGTVRAGRTKIKFVTEGILLREAEEDILLRKYSVVVLDEVHERNADTDLLLAIVSRIVPLRAAMWKEHEEARRAGRAPPPLPALPQEEGGGGGGGSGAAAAYSAPEVTPLKVIIMSATLNVQALIRNKQLFGAMETPPPVIQVRQHRMFGSIDCVSCAVPQVWASRQLATRRRRRHRRRRRRRPRYQTPRLSSLRLPCCSCNLCLSGGVVCHQHIVRDCLVVWMGRWKDGSSP
jgi:hypothetical protein